MAILPAPRSVQRQAPSLGALLSALSRFGAEQRANQIGAFQNIGQGLGSIGAGIGQGLGRRNQLLGQQMLAGQAQDAAAQRQQAAADAAMERALLNNEAKAQQAELDRKAMLDAAKVRQGLDINIGRTDENVRRARDMGRGGSRALGGMFGAPTIGDSADIQPDPARVIPPTKPGAGPTRIKTATPPPAGQPQAPAFQSQVFRNKVLKEKIATPEVLRPDEQLTPQDAANLNSDPVKLMYRNALNLARQGATRDEVLASLRETRDNPAYKNIFLSQLGKQDAVQIPTGLFEVRQIPSPGGFFNMAPPLWRLFDKATGREITNEEMQAMGIKSLGVKTDKHFMEGGLDMTAQPRKPNMMRLTPEGRIRLAPAFRDETLGLLVDDIMEMAGRQDG